MLLGCVGTSPVSSCLAVWMVCLPSAGAWEVGLALDRGVGNR